MGTDYTNDPRPSPTDEIREYDYDTKPVLTPIGQTTEVVRRFKLDHPRDGNLFGRTPVRYDRFRVTTTIYHDGAMIVDYHVHGIELTQKGEPDKRKDARWHTAHTSLPGIQDLIDALDT